MSNEQSNIPAALNCTYAVQINDDFGCILNCAVRYSIGRRTYMPHLVVDYITPLLPFLNNKTIYAFDRDITDQQYFGGYGDETIDRPHWMKFHEAVKEEERRREMEPYNCGRNPNA